MSDIQVKADRGWRIFILSLRRSFLHASPEGLSKDSSCFSPSFYLIDLIFDCFWKRFYLRDVLHGELNKGTACRRVLVLDFYSGDRQFSNSDFTLPDNGSLLMVAGDNGSC